MDALEQAAVALCGPQGAQIISELYTLLDAAEKRGHADGFAEGYHQGFMSSDADTKLSEVDQSWVDAAMEGMPADADYENAMTRHKFTVDDDGVVTKTSISDEEFYKALDEAFDEKPWPAGANLPG